MHNRTGQMLRITLTLALATSLGTLAANATPIFLGTTGAEHGNALTAFNELKPQIALYNAAYDPDLPTAIWDGHFDVPSVSGDNKTFSLVVTGWDYLVFKAGSSFYHYYVGQDTGSVGFSAKHGLSNYKFFKGATPPPPSVPDTAATVALLGIALLGAESVRRRLRR